MEHEERIMSSRIPVVRSCFFFIPLRIGSLIIGYFGALESGAKAIFSSVLLVAILASNANEEPPSSLSLYVMAYMLVIVILIAAGINKILSIVLIIGGHTRKHNLLKVYFTYGIALAVCNIAFTVLLFVIGSALYGGINTALVVIHVISIFVVYCTYVQMSEEIIQKEYTQGPCILNHSSADSNDLNGSENRSLEFDDRNYSDSNRF